MLFMNEIKGYLRDFRINVPEVIYESRGLKIFGRRIKSIVFSTDASIIRNCNADAVIAVYPFTPQPVITQAVMMAQSTACGCRLHTGRILLSKVCLKIKLQG